jgi:hypothetical protein
MKRRVANSKSIPTSTSGISSRANASNTGFLIPTISPLAVGKQTMRSIASGVFWVIGQGACNMPFEYEFVKFSDVFLNFENEKNWNCLHSLNPNL